MTRRNFFAKTGLTGFAGFLAHSAHAYEADAQRDQTRKQISNQADLNQHPPPGEPGTDYTPVVTPNGSTLPHRVIDEVKVFHLIAGEVDHEFAPGLRAECWGFNNQVHGPTIEAVEGDRVRIYVTNKLPEAIPFIYTDITGRSSRWMAFPSQKQRSLQVTRFWSR